MGSVAVTCGLVAVTHQARRAGTRPDGGRSLLPVAPPLRRGAMVAGIEIASRVIAEQRAGA